MFDTSRSNMKAQHCSFFHSTTRKNTLQPWVDGKFQHPNCCTMYSVHRNESPCHSHTIVKTSLFCHINFIWKNWRKKFWTIRKNESMTHKLKIRPTIQFIVRKWVIKFRSRGFPVIVLARNIAFLRNEPSHRPKIYESMNNTMPKTTTVAVCVESSNSMVLVSRLDFFYMIATYTRFCQEIEDAESAISYNPCVHAKHRSENRTLFVSSGLIAIGVVALY